MTIGILEGPEYPESRLTWERTIAGRISFDSMNLFKQVLHYLNWDDWDDSFEPLVDVIGPFKNRGIDAYPVIFRMLGVPVEMRATRRMCSRVPWMYLDVTGASKSIDSSLNIIL